MATYISSMRNPKHWTCSRHTRLSSKIDSVKEFNKSNLTIVVNTMPRYDESGEQCPGPFAIFLEECGIYPQYIRILLGLKH
jgi:hypothetical protein